MSDQPTLADLRRGIDLTPYVESIRAVGTAARRATEAMRRYHRDAWIKQAVRRDEWVRPWPVSDFGLLAPSKIGRKRRKRR